MRIGDVNRCVSSPGRILRDLQETRVREALLRPGEGVHAEVDGGLEDKEHPHSGRLRADLYLDVVEASSLLQRCHRFVHFCLRKWLILVLCQ